MNERHIVKAHRHLAAIVESSEDAILWKEVNDHARGDLGRR